MYNLLESEAEEGNDRKNHDLSDIGALLQQIELPMTVKDDIASIRRIGKIPITQPAEQTDADAPPNAPQKPRPLLVSFKSPLSRKDILTNAKKLAKSPLAHVSICPDLTKAQQTEDRKLRDEVKNLNAGKPSDDKGVFYGRLWVSQVSRVGER